MGVKRAVDLVFKTARKYKNHSLFTYGPIIHNHQVLRLLEKKGIRVITSPDEAPAGSVVVIRAHGVPPEVKDKLAQKKVIVVDATCPRVLKVQQLIKQYYQKDYHVIIIGEREHPEVKGLCGYAQNQALVIENKEEIKNLEGVQKLIIVAQTTQNETLFKHLAAFIKQHNQEAKIFNTICYSTHERQEEVRKLAKKVEAFVVIGGKNSGNTKRLAQIANEAKVKTYHIETEEELDPKEIGLFKAIGITAGASTPYWLIRRLIFRLEEILAHKVSLWWQIPYQGLKLALLSNLWSALGGASLAIIGIKLSVIDINRAPFIAFTYLWAIHVLSHLTDLETTRLTDPTKVKFYEKHRFIFITVGIICFFISLVLSKPWPLAFFSICFLIFSGLIYNIKIPFLKYKLKNLPASKTIVVPLAWGFIGGIFPLFLENGLYFSLKAFLVFIYLCALAFMRTCCFDLLDIQGDQMVGRETLPIVLGEKNTFRLLYILIAVLIIVTILLVLTGYFPGYSYFYSVILGFSLIYLVQMEKRNFRPGVLIEALIDAQLMIMALWSLLWIK